MEVREYDNRCPPMLRVRGPRKLQMIYWIERNFFLDSRESAFIVCTELKTQHSMCTHAQRLILSINHTSGTLAEIISNMFAIYHMAP